MRLDIRLDAASKMPLYQQLVAAISSKIRAGDFADGERLPSVRDLALEVRINPNTVARAYQELEKAAIVVSERGRGVFVRLPDGGGDGLPAELDQALDSLIDTAREVDYPLDRLDGEVRRRVLDLSRKED